MRIKCSSYLSRLFRRLDKDRSWTLSKDEMRRGVTQFGLDFSEADIDKLFAAFEKDGQAGINYEEFLEALRVRPGSSAQRIVIGKVCCTCRE